LRELAARRKDHHEETGREGMFEETPPEGGQDIEKEDERGIFSRKGIREKGQKKVDNIMRDKRRVDKHGKRRYEEKREKA